MRQRSTVVGMAAAAAFSGASFSADAGPAVNACPASAHLSTYLSGGANATCTVLDKTISGMTFSANPSAYLPASGVTVNPVTVVNDPGLAFKTNQGSGTSQSTTITFTITAPANSPMTDASVAIGGRIFLAGGAFSVSEMLSNNGSLSASNGSPSGSTTFSPVTSLTVTELAILKFCGLDAANKSVFRDPCCGADPEAVTVGVVSAARHWSLGA